MFNSIIATREILSTVKAIGPNMTKQEVDKIQEILLSVVGRLIDEAHEDDSYEG